MHAPSRQPPRQRRQFPQFRRVLAAERAGRQIARQQDQSGGSDGKATQVAPSLQPSETDRKQTSDISKLDKRVERRERITLAVAVVGVLIAGASVYVSEQQRRV